MPSALEQDVKDRVRNLWFSGETRNNIAAECGIGAGSVTNIVKEWTQDLESSDFESMREMAVELKKEGLTFAQLGSMNRFHNYIKKLGADLDQIESLIFNLLDKTKSIPIEKTAELVNQLYEISESTHVSPNEVPVFVKQKIEEKERIEEEVEKAGATLQQKNVDIQTIGEFKKLEEELEKYGMSMESPHKLVSVLLKINQMGYDPLKIVKELARIKSLKRLKSDCKFLESRVARYRQLLPMCDQIVRFGIGIGELIAFHAAVMKKVDLENIPYRNAAFTLMDGIDTSNKLVNARKQLNDTIMKIQMVNLFSVRQNDALDALMQLRACGVTVEEILNIYGMLNSASLENDRRLMYNPRNTFGAPK